MAPASMAILPSVARRRRVWHRADRKVVLPITQEPPGAVPLVIPKVNSKNGGKTDDRADSVCKGMGTRTCALNLHLMERTFRFKEQKSGEAIRSIVWNVEPNPRVQWVKTTHHTQLFTVLPKPRTNPCRLPQLYPTTNVDSSPTTKSTPRRTITATVNSSNATAETSNHAATCHPRRTEMTGHLMVPERSDFPLPTRQLPWTLRVSQGADNRPTASSPARASRPGFTTSRGTRTGHSDAFQHRSKTRPPEGRQTSKHDYLLLAL